MDCLGNRLVWRWVGRFVLGVCPLTAFGCVTPGTMPAVTPLPTPSEEAKLPKITPKPSTCVEAGRVLEAGAGNPKRTPQEQADLLEKARVSYKQALKTEPNNIAALQGVARVTLKQGNYEEGRAVLQQVVLKSPQEASLWYDLAMCEARHKDFEPAVRSMYKAATLAPENKTYSAAYGHLLARSGRFDDSLAHFTRLVGPAQAHYQVARMQHHMHQVQPARANLEQALAIDPNMDQARQLLAAIDSGAAVPGGPAQINFEE